MASAFLIQARANRVKTMAIVGVLGMLVTTLAVKLGSASWACAIVFALIPMLVAFLAYSDAVKVLKKIRSSEDGIELHVGEFLRKENVGGNEFTSYTNAYVLVNSAEVRFEDAKFTSLLSLKGKTVTVIKSNIGTVVAVRGKLKVK